MIASALALLIFIAFIALIGALLTWLYEAEQPTEELSSEAPNDTSTSLQQLVESVNQKLPQTQCAQCAHPGCRPYAEAIVKHDAPINQCPPGGDALIAELAEYLGKEVIPLDNQRGENKPPQVAIIEEPTCIGCTLCLLACPVDAIVGAPRLMHTIIADQCTGCELCIPPCPVDCISLELVAKPLSEWAWPKP